MKRLLVIFLFIISVNGIAQTHAPDFIIDMPTVKVPNSLYNTIQYIDLRPDSSFGFLQAGTFNRKTNVVVTIPLATQLSNLLHALTDSTAKNGELLLQINRCNFSEINTADTKKSYCQLQAILYGGKNGHYQKLQSFDSVITIESTTDITKESLKNVGYTLTTLIAQNLLKVPTDSIDYSLTDIIKADSLEQLNIPLYTATTYTDGLYYTYQSFRNQAPDGKITAKQKDSATISSVKTAQKDGSLTKLDPKSVYAIVYKGCPFIATRYGFYRLYKINGDLIFTGDIQVAVNGMDLMVAGIMFGLIGELATQRSEQRATYEVKINHANGNFIRLKYIKPTEIPDALGP
ncbi:MAG TPA: hypothetical protein VK718_08600 [Ferruginibacter sp.]|jgi:hypothetical protein|nr:hypothetical protein [Ferruginibacter sp.]